MIVRAFNDSDVAEHALLRKKSGLLVENSAEELVRGAKPFHQDIALTIVNKLNGL